MGKKPPQTPPPPPELRDSGRALWVAVMIGFALDEHELALLREACRTVDNLDALTEQLELDGIMSESSQGSRVHPALPELRQQRIALARLLAALRIPTGTQETAPQQYRGIRGVYGIGAAREAS